MEKKELRCIKDVEFLGRTYAKKGEMIEVESVGSYMGFNGSNGLFFSMSIDVASEHFNRNDLKNLYDSVYKGK